MEMSAALDALGALAQESRLQVFRLLVQRGPSGLPAGEIAERLDIPPATLSFHLGQLGQAGLVVSKRNGRSIIYSADFKGMDRLMGFLYENCCQGACVPAARVSRKRKSEES
jgi:ArsR family transcriptional regulator, arsenate/arsenite/antimonite-responsive transcriptional repressor